MRFYSHSFFLMTFALAAGTSAYAQEAEFPGPEKEHAFLKRFAGEWTNASECFMGPNQPPMKTTATTKSRMIGEFWIVSEIKSEGGGQTVTAIQTIGYDAQKKKYVGTWIDSMFNHLWHYEGTVDETGNILTLEAEGPNFMTGEGTTEFRDVYEFKSDNAILARSYAKDKDGKWVEFVTGHAKRKTPDK